MNITTVHTKNIITKRTFNKIDEAVTRFISIGLEDNPPTDRTIAVVKGAIVRWLTNREEEGILEKSSVSFWVKHNRLVHVGIRFRQRHCLVDTEIEYAVSL